MNRSSASRSLALPVSAIVLGVLVLAVVAGGALGRAADPGSPSPSVVPSAPASVAPSPKPSATPSVAPSDVPADGPIVVKLDVATPHDVSVVINDETGRLVKASSGRAGDGMSVRWYTMAVENVNAETLRLTWSGYSVDDELELRVHEVDGKIALSLVQAGPLPNTDALGADRVLVLEFDRPVSAEDVVTSVEGPSADGD
jgi:hypothetical protein